MKNKLKAFIPQDLYLLLKSSNNMSEKTRQALQFFFFDGRKALQECVTALEILSETLPFEQKSNRFIVSVALERAKQALELQ